MKEVVIVSACRTAIGAFGGRLERHERGRDRQVSPWLRPWDRAGIDPALIDDVRFGNCMEPVDALQRRPSGRLDGGNSLTARLLLLSTGCAYPVWRPLFPAWP